MRCWLVVAVVAVLAAGCGATQQTADDTIRAEMAKVQTTCTEGLNCDQPPEQASGRTCDLTGMEYRGRDFRTCWGPNALHPNPTIERRTPSGWELVTGPLIPSDMSAQWGAVWLSPDQQTLLADWQYPCDSSVVVFVPARGGEARLVTGERDWRKAPVADGVGWTRDGKARVRLYTAWQGHQIKPRHPRVFLFDPDLPARDAQPAEKRGC
jgi:hypothetical protein